MLLLFCWTEGAAGLPTNTSDADIRGCRAVKTAAPPRGFIPSGLTQPSIGDLPHCIARVPAGIALPLFGSVVCQSHRKTIESSGPASRPAQLHPRLNPYRQLTHAYGVRPRKDHRGVGIDVSARVTPPGVRALVNRFYRRKFLLGEDFALAMRQAKEAAEQLTRSYTPTSRIP